MTQGTPAGQQSAPANPCADRQQEPTLEPANAVRSHTRHKRQDEQTQDTAEHGPTPANPGADRQQEPTLEPANAVRSHTHHKRQDEQTHSTAEQGATLANPSADRQQEPTPEPADAQDATTQGTPAGQQSAPANPAVEPSSPTNHTSHEEATEACPVKPAMAQATFAPEAAVNLNTPVQQSTLSNMADPGQLQQAPASISAGDQAAACMQHRHDSNNAEDTLVVADTLRDDAPEPGLALQLCLLPQPWMEDRQPDPLEEDLDGELLEATDIDDLADDLLGSQLEVPVS